MKTLFNLTHESEVEINTEICSFLTSFTQGKEIVTLEGHEVTFMPAADTERYFVTGLFTQSLDAMHEAEVRVLFDANGQLRKSPDVDTYFETLAQVLKVPVFQGNWNYDGLLICASAEARAVTFVAVFCDKPGNLA